MTQTFKQWWAENGPVTPRNEIRWTKERYESAYNAGFKRAKAAYDKILDTYKKKVSQIIDADLDEAIAKERKNDYKNK